jgi:hypothetical protein
LWEDGVIKPVVHDGSDGARAVAIAGDDMLGAWRLVAGPDPAGRPPALLFCENETNVPKLIGGPASTPYPKDGVNGHVVNGAATVNSDRRGTKMACWYRFTIPARETIELRLRLVAMLQGRPWISAACSHKRKPTEAAKPTNITPRYGRNERATKKRW